MGVLVLLIGPGRLQLRVILLALLLTIPRSTLLTPGLPAISRGLQTPVLSDELTFFVRGDAEIEWQEACVPGMWCGQVRVASAWVRSCSDDAAVLSKSKHCAQTSCSGANCCAVLVAR